LNRPARIYRLSFHQKKFLTAERNSIKAPCTLTVVLNPWGGSTMCTNSNAVTRLVSRKDSPWLFSLPVVALMVSLALAVPVRSQTSSGSIAGSVRDAQDAATANATVTIAEQQRKTTYTAKTDAEGRFVFPQLLPGIYSISVEARGFKKVERKDIALLANDKISVGNITLQIGGISETVVVSAQAVELKTESSERSDAIVGKQITDLAVNSRSYLQLAGLATGEL